MLVYNYSISHLFLFVFRPPSKVGSHYHFIETNKELRFDRRRSYGRRLHIVAGTAVRFEPGDTKTVTLVDIAGKKVVRGGNGETKGWMIELWRRQHRKIMFLFFQANFFQASEAVGFSGRVVVALLKHL